LRPHTGRVQRCRICGSLEFQSVLDLGEQVLTGVFPASVDASPTAGPLELLRCSAPGACGLVQLAHTYDHAEMYGENYGYRSSLNASMSNHLAKKAEHLRQLVSLSPEDLVIDIGSNDGTFLSKFPRGSAQLLGVDPTASKFRKYYREDIVVIDNFFSPDDVLARTNGRRAKLITSIAMFYDLDAPIEFAKGIRCCLEDNGLWHFEQSYLPAMLDTNSYDTICHEHLEYYSLKQIKWILDEAGFQVVDVSFNSVNGGSFAVTASPVAKYPNNDSAIAAAYQAELNCRLDTVEPYDRFRSSVLQHRDDLNGLISGLKTRGKRIFGYGASTKGNVLLQFCGLDTKSIDCIADVNEEKFGKLTPGTHIPIVDEIEARRAKPDIFLVLPWHFREFISQKERRFIADGGELLFPLPHIIREKKN